MALKKSLIVTSILLFIIISGLTIYDNLPDWLDSDLFMLMLIITILFISILLVGL